MKQRPDRPSLGDRLKHIRDEVRQVVLGDPHQEKLQQRTRQDSLVRATEHETNQQALERRSAVVSALPALLDNQALAVLHLVLENGVFTAADEDQLREMIAKVEALSQSQQLSTALSADKIFFARNNDLLTTLPYDPDFYQPFLVDIKPQEEVLILTPWILRLGETGKPLEKGRALPARLLATLSSENVTLELIQYAAQQFAERVQRALEADKKQLLIMIDQESRNRYPQGHPLLNRLRLELRSAQSSLSLLETLSTLGLKLPSEQILTVVPRSGNIGSNCFIAPNFDGSTSPETDKVLVLSPPIVDTATQKVKFAGFAQVWNEPDTSR